MPITLWAQSPPVPDSVAVLEEVVIQALSQSAGSPWVSEQDYHGTNPMILETLDRLPGVFNVQANSYPLSYRGLSAARLRVETNGIRRTGVTTQGYYATDLNPAALSGVSVVQGIAKAAFGSGAIGGVIRADQHSAHRRLPSLLYGGYDTNNQGLLVGGRWFLVDRAKFKTYVAGRHQSNSEFKFPSGERALNSAVRQTQLSAAGTWLPNRLHSIDARSQLSFGVFERPQGFQNNPNELRTLQNRYTWQGDVKWRSRKNQRWPHEQQVWGLAVGSDQYFDRYNATSGDLVLQDIRHYDKRAVGYRGLWVHSFRDVLMRTGADAYTMIQDETRSHENFQTGSSRDKVPEPRRSEVQVGGYAHLLFTLSDTWFASSLLRWDAAWLRLADNTTAYTQITGGAELTHFTPKGQQVISVGRYFRYPTVDEAVGLVLGGRGVFEGNPDLEPELSYELEMTASGIVYSQLYYQVTGWFSYFLGRISEVLVAPPTSFSYQNIAFARTYGIEAWLQWRSIISQEENAYWVAELSGTWQRGDEVNRGPLGPEVDPLLGIPPARMRSRLEYVQPIRHRFILQLQASLDRVFAFTRIPSGFNNQIWGVQAADPYWLLGAEVSLKQKKDDFPWEIGVRGRNLANARYFPLGTRIPERGRSLQIFFRFQWP